jgi:ATP phosphoribosyltransferase
MSSTATWIAVSPATIGSSKTAPKCEVGEFQFSKATSQPARWVLAVPEDSPIKSPKDLQGKRIATEVVNITKRYLRKHGVKAEVEFSWGATEVKAHELVDAIVEITETGSSLRANKLRIVDTLLVSTPRLIVNHTSWKDPWKRQKSKPWRCCCGARWRRKARSA